MPSHPQPFTKGYSNNADLDAEVDSYSKLVVSYDLSTKQTSGEFATVLDFYTTAGGRWGKRSGSVENSIRFQLYGGRQALPAGARSLGKKLFGWSLYYENRVNLPGDIAKVLTFVP